MRFSLVSLLLFTIWIGAALGVWFRREAWVLERFEPASDIELNLKMLIIEDANPYPSPDATRNVLTSNPFFHHFTGFQILEMPSEKGLYSHNCFPVVVDVSNPRFLTNDQIYIRGFHSEDGYGRAYYRRRFPEWWWGHFYRPEVWAFALITIALLVRGVQALRRRRVAAFR